MPISKHAYHYEWCYHSERELFHKNKTMFQKNIQAKTAPTDMQGMINW